MNEAEIFRFPEEAAAEAALRAMPADGLLAMLEKRKRKLMSAEPAGGSARAGSVLDVMRTEADRFLCVWRKRIDVFGRVQNADAMYHAFCALQTVLEEGTCRLSGIAAAPHTASVLTAQERWSVLRLSQGLVPDAAVTAAAEAVLHCQRNAEEAEKQEAERLELLRIFLRRTVRAYGERALKLSDAGGGGARMEAGALCALIAEFASAAADCKKGLDEIRGM